MPKSTKRFVLSDSSLNKFGFRILTDGIDLSQFEKNPIMLFMHSRAFGNYQDQVLPIGHWEDIKKEGDTITAIPVFDEDEFSMKIYEKVESGTLRMASIGVDPVEFSEDPKDLVQGQRFATVTKSIAEEASICDLGANRNALAFYKKGQLITLSDQNIPDFIPEIKIKNHKPMSKLTNLAVALKLAADENDENVIQKAIEKLGTIETLQREKEDLAVKLADVEKRNKEEKINRIVDEAVTAGKITASQKDFYIKLADSNLETTEALLNSMQAYKSVEKQLSDHADKPDEKLLKLSWDELDKTNKLADLKNTNPEVYREKFKEKFGKEPTA